MLVWGHLNEGVLQVCFARGFLSEPDFVEALSADAAAEMGVKLWVEDVVLVENGERLALLPATGEEIPQSWGAPCSRALQSRNRAFWT